MAQWLQYRRKKQAGGGGPSGSLPQSGRVLSVPTANPICRPQPSPAPLRVDPGLRFSVEAIDAALAAFGVVPEVPTLAISVAGSRPSPRRGKS